MQPADATSSRPAGSCKIDKQQKYLDTKSITIKLSAQMPTKYFI